MPRLIEERWVGVGFAVYTEHLPVTDPNGNIVHDAHGLPKTVEHTTIQFQHIDSATGLPALIVRIPFVQEAKQELIRQLTGGVVVPNGRPLS